MEVFEWKDDTTYSQSDKKRVPRSWGIVNGDISITVTRRIHEEGWFLFCYIIGIECKQLKSEKIEDAKREAFLVVQVYLDELSRDFRDLVIGAK